MNTHDLEDLPVLRTRLDALAERSAPPSAVDVRAARRSGERVRIRRTAGRLTAAVAVVMAGVLCVTVLPSLLRSAAHPGPVGDPVTTPATANAWGHTPLVRGADPYYASADFGWLPPGYVQQIPSDFGNEVIMLSGWGPVDPLTGADSAWELVTQYSVAIARQPPGAESYSFTGPTQDTIVDIDGQSAILQVGPSQDGSVIGANGTSPKGEPPLVTDLLGMLSWRTTGGYFAQLTVILPAGTPDAAATIAHVATSLRVSDVPVPVPFYFQNLPAALGSLREDGPDSPPKDNAWIFSVSLGVDEPAVVNINVSPVGSPANSTDNADVPSDEVCKVENGLDICVYTNGGPMPPALAEIGRQGLLNDIVGLGTDPAVWTTDVDR